MRWKSSAKHNLCRTYETTHQSDVASTPPSPLHPYPPHTHTPSHSCMSFDRLPPELVAVVVASTSDVVSMLSLGLACSSAWKATCERSWQLGACSVQLMRRLAALVTEATRIASHREAVHSLFARLCGWWLSAADLASVCSVLPLSVSWTVYETSTNPLPLSHEAHCTRPGLCRFFCEESRLVSRFLWNRRTQQRDCLLRCRLRNATDLYRGEAGDERRILSMRPSSSHWQFRTYTTVVIVESPCRSSVVGTLLWDEDGCSL